jgi:cytochrome c-type biogenesis protein CcmH
MAFIGFMFLFLIVFMLYLIWNEFFLSIKQRNLNATGQLEESPEWLAFLDRRREIDSDPNLDEKTRATLIESWKSMASESKPRMIKATPNEPRLNFSGLLPPLPWVIGIILSLAILFLYIIGAIHHNAFEWPSPNSSTGNTLDVNQVLRSNQSVDHPGDGVSLDERLATLKARLTLQPEDLRGWVLLARTHASMSNYSQSVDALKTALNLSPSHPDILADLADMIAMAQGRKLTGESEKYIALALQSDPRHEKALALAASAAEQAGNSDKAQVYWQLLSQVQQSNLTNMTPTAPITEQVFTRLNVSIPESALSSMNEKSALFVYLKSQSGPGMPLAVVRIPATQLKPGVQPIQIAFSDFIQEDAINSLPETIYFQARLSIQGMAQSGLGDIESGWVDSPSNELDSGLTLSLPENGAP